MSMKPATLAVQPLHAKTTGAIAPPLHLSTTYRHGPANERIADHEYVRDANPDVDALETRLALLEGADSALAFASGMAAANAILSSLPPNARVILHSQMYLDGRVLATQLARQGRLKVEVADFTNLAELDAVLAAPADLLWFETPTNPLLEIIDIEAVAAKGHDAGALVMVDSTIAPPTIQRPHAFGADIVLHSLTKYAGGHSDIQGGSLSFANCQDLRSAMLLNRRYTGGVLSPFNAWMLSRGLMTLDCRMKRHSRTATFLAERLTHHPAIETVHYPMLKSHPGFAIACKQMSAGGGMLSIEVRGGARAAIEVAGRVRLFTNATSFGGPESLIEHRRSVEGSQSQSPEGLLRLSIGLEDPEDLLDDLMHALSDEG